MPFLPFPQFRTESSHDCQLFPLPFLLLCHFAIFALFCSFWQFCYFKFEQVPYDPHVISLGSMMLMFDCFEASSLLSGPLDTFSSFWVDLFHDHQNDKPRRQQKLNTLDKQ